MVLMFSAKLVPPTSVKKNWWLLLKKNDGDVIAKKQLEVKCNKVVEKYTPKK